MDRQIASPDRGRPATRTRTGESDRSTPAGATAQVHAAVGNQTVQREATDEAAAGPTSFSDRISGTVPTLQQPSSMSCWATATAMMLSWRDGASYSIEEAMRVLDRNSPTIYYEVEEGDTLWEIADTYYGDPTDFDKIQRATPRLSEGQSHIEPGWTLRVPEFWLTRFQNNIGLMDYHFDELMQVSGLVGETRGVNWTMETFRAKLRQHGPLWITTDVDMDPGSGNIALHVRIVTGIWGDGTPNGTTVRIVDPADGQAHEYTGRQFRAQFEEAMGLPSQTDQYQLLHWP